MTSEQTATTATAIDRWQRKRQNDASGHRKDVADYCRRRRDDKVWIMVHRRVGVVEQCVDGVDLGEALEEWNQIQQLRVWHVIEPRRDGDLCMQKALQLT